MKGGGVKMQLSWKTNRRVGVLCKLSSLIDKSDLKLDREKGDESEGENHQRNGQGKVLFFYN